MSVKFTWLGHSAFVFDIDGHEVLVDPFLTGNPLAAAKANSLNPELILLSHAHGDHLGDTVDIAKRSQAPVITNYEIANWLANKGVQNAIGINTGGTFYGEWCSAKWTIAHHSSSFDDGSYGGQPNGFILRGGGYTIYYAGDTSLFLDMQLIGDEGIDVAFLPIGDYYTMGPLDSLRAIDFVRPEFVVPMHYNTFPPIVQDVSDWANRVNSETDAKPIVLDPGGSHSLD